MSNYRKEYNETGLQDNIKEWMLNILNLMDKEERLIILFDFCDWLQNNGCEYETINYGDDVEIKGMIMRYLDDEDWVKAYE